MLNVIDEFTHECLAIRVARKLKSIDVIDVLSDLFILRGVPGHIRSDNGPEFVAKAVQEWIAAVGAKTAYIDAGQPLGERLRRELQRTPARRTARRRDLLHAARGARSSSRAGGVTTTPSGRTHRSATNHQHRRCSCLHSPRGRLRYVDRLRRPR